MKDHAIRDEMTDGPNRFGVIDPGRALCAAMVTKVHLTNRLGYPSSAILGLGRELGVMPLPPLWQARMARRSGGKRIGDGAR